MKTRWFAPLSLVLAIALLASSGHVAASPQGGATLHLPLVLRALECPATSGNSYSQGIAYQRDTDNPVRLAWNHADKNLALRGYTLTSAAQAFVDYGSDDPTQPPQFATLFEPDRVPVFSNVYRANSWNWLPSPDPGFPGGPITDWPVTVIGFQTTPGEILQVPHSNYDIGGNMEVIVMFADQDSITFKYTRDDSVQPNGYTLHVDNICTDPNLLALYNSLDTGPRYVYVGYPYSYNLPNLADGQTFGTARATEIRAAIVDTGAFLDPRSCNEWWQIRPGASCP